MTTQAEALQQAKEAMERARNKVSVERESCPPCDLDKWDYYDSALAALATVSSEVQPVSCGGRENCSRFPFCGCGAEPAFPERDTSKPAEQQGLFRKFDVRRVDGSDRPGGKHCGCRYYVLDLDHDKHAPAAMRAYATACKETHPNLAADIDSEFAARPAPAVSDASPSPSVQPSTPSSRWAANGEPDPHGDGYDCERAALTLGKLTDDELANAAFMNYDRRPSFQDIVDGKAHMPIVYMTAVKERIRWLSRSLEKAFASQTAQPISSDAQPVAFANWKVGTKSYVPFRTREEAEASVLRSEVSATQNGPYAVAELYASPAPDVRPHDWLLEKIATMSTREERLGGQRTKYVQRDEVIGWIEEAAKRIEGSKQ